MIQALGGLLWTVVDTAKVPEVLVRGMRDGRFDGLTFSPQPPFDDRRVSPTFKAAMRRPGTSTVALRGDAAVWRANNPSCEGAWLLPGNSIQIGCSLPRDLIELIIRNDHLGRPESVTFRASLKNFPVIGVISSEA